MGLKETAMPNSRHATHKDLHAMVEPNSTAIEFRVIRRGQSVRVDVPRETLDQCFGVGGTRHGLLIVYETHRDQIDDAVMRRADSDGAGIIVVRPKDLH
jgi:hypothetical protein